MSRRLSKALSLEVGMPVIIDQVEGADSEESEDRPADESGIHIRKQSKKEEIET